MKREVGSFTLLTLPILRDFPVQLILELEVRHGETCALTFPYHC